MICSETYPNVCWYVWSQILLRFGKHCFLCTLCLFSLISSSIIFAEICFVCTLGSCTLSSGWNACDVSSYCGDSVSESCICDAFLTVDTVSYDTSIIVYVLSFLGSNVQSVPFPCFPVVDIIVRGTSIQTFRPLLVVCISHDPDSKYFLCPCSLPLKSSVCS